MSFKDFVQKYKLKNKATSIIKIQQVLVAIGSDNVRIYLKDGPLSSDIGIVKLQPSKATHWVDYIDENYFDSYGCSPPQNLSKFIIKRIGYCLYPEYKIEGLDSYCGSYWFFILYLTKVLGIYFKTAVLKLYYQMIQKR